MNDKNDDQKKIAEILDAVGKSTFGAKLVETAKKAEITFSLEDMDTRTAAYDPRTKHLSINKNIPDHIQTVATEHALRRVYDILHPSERPKPPKFS
jgi:type III secretion system FlhB-like substrate exporter